MVDPLATYTSILERGIALFDDIIQLYRPDVRAPLDWADRTVAQATTTRNGLAERLAAPRLTAAYTSTLVATILNFIDSHWADYQELPVADAAKREQVVRLHAALEALTNEVAPLHNALRAAAPAQ